VSQCWGKCQFFSVLAVSIVSGSVVFLCPGKKINFSLFQQRRKGFWYRGLCVLVSWEVINCSCVGACGVADAHTQYTHTYMHTFQYTCTHTKTHTHTYTYIHTCKQTHIHRTTRSCWMAAVARMPSSRGAIKSAPPSRYLFLFDRMYR